MGVLVQTVEGTLPLELMERLSKLRRRYRQALELAATGNFSMAEDLHTLHTTLGRILAREAKKSVAERGMRMMDLSLSVYRYFPEFTTWSEREAMAAHRKRLQEMTGTPRPVVSDRAS